MTNLDTGVTETVTTVSVPVDQGQPEQLKIQLSRYDIVELETTEFPTDVDASSNDNGQAKALQPKPGNDWKLPQVYQMERKPKDRGSFLKSYNLPAESIIKLKYNGNLIPWSLVPHCNCQKNMLDIQVFRPHQNSKYFLFLVTSILYKSVHL